MAQFLAMNPTPLFLSLGLLTLAGCALNRPVHNPSGAEAAAAEVSRLPDPIAERKAQKAQDNRLIEQRAAGYERQGYPADQARARAEIDYATPAK